MTRSRLSWPLGLLACGALIAGCGSSSTTTSQSSSTTATTTSAPAATSSTTATTATGTSSTAGKSAASIQQEIVQCKQEIAAQSSLPAKAKAKLEAVCAKAAKGDTAAVKQAAREICEEVINGSAVPAGPTREKALAACKGK